MRIDSYLLEDIVLGLDAALGLDPVWSDSALDEVFASKLVGLLLQDLIESLSKLLPLLLR